MRTLRIEWRPYDRKEHSQEWLCHENVKPKSRVLDFYGDDQAFECS